MGVVRIGSAEGFEGCTDVVGTVGDEFAIERLVGVAGEYDLLKGGVGSYPVFVTDAPGTKILSYIPGQKQEDISGLNFS